MLSARLRSWLPSIEDIILSVLAWPLLVFDAQEDIGAINRLQPRPFGGAMLLAGVVCGILALWLGPRPVPARSLDLVGLKAEKKNRRLRAARVIAAVALCMVAYIGGFGVLLVAGTNAAFIGSLAVAFVAGVLCLLASFVPRPASPLALRRALATPVQVAALSWFTGIASGLQDAKGAEPFLVMALIPLVFPFYVILVSGPRGIVGQDDTWRARLSGFCLLMASFGLGVGVLP